MSKKVEIRPIERKQWHGKTGKESFSAPKNIRVLVDSETFTYKLDLSDEERESLGKKLGLDLSTTHTEGNPHPVWDTKIGAVKLPNQTKVLNRVNPRDELQYQICRASSRVANSLKEYKEGKFPEATHVIYSEIEEVKEKSSLIEKKNKAVLAVSKLSREDKNQALIILQDIDASKKSEDFVLVEINKIIERDVDSLFRFLEDDKDLRTTEALVRRCIKQQILNAKGHKIFYGDMSIGKSERDVAEYLLKLDNQDLKIELMGKLDD